MPGPQTQHKGTVYGDDENAPKPELGLTYLLTYAAKLNVTSAGSLPQVCPGRTGPCAR